MSSARIAVLFVGVTMAVGACQAHDGAVNSPDPNMYALRFGPDAVSIDVGFASTVALYASQTGVGDIDIRSVEFTVANPAVASLGGSALTNVPPTYATIVITCHTAGQTKVGGVVTLDDDQRLTQTMTVTCTPPPSAP